MTWLQLGATLIGCTVGASVVLTAYLIGERWGWWW